MDSLVTSTGPMSIDDVLDALDQGRRVVVRFGYRGDAYGVTLRRDGRAYYCDFPMRGHRHESREEMRACIEVQGYDEEWTQQRSAPALVEQGE